MILKMPIYCKSFRCIADKCTDNCCVGWEIDIDSASADYYKSIKGAFGDKLRKNIADGEVCSFILKDERCPFLNEKNLCEIIISLGEDKLCQICRDHPRFFEWYSDIKEGGIGLCCEEAARIIVTNTEPFATYDTPCGDEGCDDYDAQLYDMLLFARDEIISTLENEKLPLGERFALVIDYACQIQHMADNYQYEKLPLSSHRPTEKASPKIKAFLEAFAYLEPIDENWTAYLKELTESADALSEKAASADTEFDLYLKNIAVYFIWRYFLKGVYDEEIFSKVMLSAVCTAMIKLMFIKEKSAGKTLTGKHCSILAKNLSKEIEYSSENLEKIYDMVYDDPAFTKENLPAIIS